MIHKLANVWGKGKIPKSTKVGNFCDIGDPQIGENCKIQCHVSIPPGWKIGNRVFIGPGARLANDKYPKATGEWRTQGGIIEDDVSIGMGALIGAGVTIKKGAVIGMGAVVLKDVEAATIVVGNPAHEI